VSTSGCPRRRRGCHALAEPGRCPCAGHDGDQLAPAGQQALEHLDGDGAEVVSHHDEVAVDDAEHITGLARPRHGHRPAGGQRDAAVPGVTCSGRHGDHVIVEVACWVVHRDRGESLHLRAGGHHRHS
jgi:hypothetical protein